MSDYMTLLGADRVHDAGHNMTRAADAMKHASDNIAETLFLFGTRMEDWVSRLEAVAENMQGRDT